MNRSLHILACLCGFLLAISVTNRSASAAPQTADDENSFALKYKFEPDTNYGYEFETETTVDGKKLSSSGYASFRLTGRDVAMGLDGKSLQKRESGESTSTGFVVTSDGYLITCAHCVEGAEKLTVQLDGKKYVAKVIDSDAGLDLAILKIEAANLPFVEFGDSATVKLAQNVRVIGFPLSRVLGDSVKIAQGIVAGFIDLDGVKNLQIDGAVNPGNSGGPLVDERGHVVGVVNAKLGGESISKVGFAIPIQYALDMLDAHSIKYTLSQSDEAPKSNEALRGPVLAAKLTPAVGFINSKIGAEGYSNFRNYSFSIGGTIAKNENDQAVRETFQSKLILGSYGALVDVQDETNLPMMFGSIARLPFETLPRSPKSWWSHIERLVIPMPTQMPKESPVQGHEFGPFDPFGHFGPHGFGPHGFGPRGFGPHGFRSRRRQTEPEIEKRMAAASQTIQYEITGRQGNLVSIKKSRALATLSDDNEFSNLRINSASQLKFDLTSGVFTRLEMTGQIKLKMGDQNLTFPLKLNYKQIDINSILASNEPKAKRTAIADRNVALSAEEVDRFVTSDLKDLPPDELHATLKVLATWNDADDHQAEIVPVLIKIIESVGPQFRKPAINALLNWKPAAATRFLIDELNGSSAFSKRSWIKKLGQTGDPLAAKALSELLTNPDQQWAAHLALVELGNASELEVLSILQSNVSNKETAGLCITILKEVGTAIAVDAIAQLVDKQQDWPLESEAKKAADGIQSRLAK